MNGFYFLNPSSCFIEISHETLRLLYREAGFEVPLERQADGRLTPACRERIISAVNGFLKRPAWQPRLRAWCAIGARGVSLRRLALPPAAKGDLKQLLRLQIESEFPLAPDELAWGYLRLDVEGRTGNSEQQEFIVAAVKKETVGEYSELLAECGVSPMFTLAALARNCLCPRPAADYAVLELGRDQSELLSYERGAPVVLRIVPVGVENFTAPDSLSTLIRNHWHGEKLFLLSTTARQKEIAASLAQGFGDGVACQPVEFPSGEGKSAAILGLRQSVETDAGRRLLVLQSETARSGFALADPGLRKWAALAGVLLLACLIFPYAEALLLKSHLAKQLAVAKASRGTLETIDRELSFLQYLRKNQSPYLDAVFLLANATPGGTRLDSLTMDRRGEISLRGSTRDLQQVVQFRSKLIESGFFSNVAVEEQTMTPDRQKVILRMTAQWKPASARESLKIGPTPEEMEKIKAAAKGAGVGSSQMMGSPSAMTPGMPPPRPTAELSKTNLIRTNTPASAPGVPITNAPTAAKKE